MNEQPKTGKISCKDRFEDCYLRHRYINRIASPVTKEELAPYNDLATHMARNTYYTYKNLFSSIGFEIEDLVSISKTHVATFLGLFSLEKIPKKYEDFVLVHFNNEGCRPNEKSILNKNKANCVLFLKQRMEDLIRICRQKVRNINGFPSEEFFYFSGAAEPPAIHKDLIKNYERLGYRKIENAVYKSVRKKANAEESTIFLFDGKYYIAVPIEQKYLTAADLAGADLDFRDCAHNTDPERTLSNVQEKEKWEKRKEAFDKNNHRVKIKTLSAFIKKNATNAMFKQEVKTAKRMLKSMGVQWNRI